MGSRYMNMKNINKIKTIFQKIKRAANALFTLLIKGIIKIYKDPQTNWLNIVIIFSTLCFIVFILFYLLFGKRFIYLSTTQVFYIFSTSAQAIAGLFGLSIAGYAFFNNYLEKEVDKDNTLEGIVEELKVKYFETIKLMGFFAILSITLSIIMIITVNKFSYIIKFILNLDSKIRNRNILLY